MISDTIFTQANKTPSEGAPVEEHVNTYEKYDKAIQLSYLIPKKYVNSLCTIKVN